jgi:uncharacterized protein YecA (UPF0149 family)
MDAEIRKIMARPKDASKPILDVAANLPRAARNRPCPCGSGKKFKRCCLLRQRAAAQEPAEAQS